MRSILMVRCHITWVQSLFTSAGEKGTFYKTQCISYIICYNLRSPYLLYWLCYSLFHVIHIFVQLGHVGGNLESCLLLMQTQNILHSCLMCRQIQYTHFHSTNDIRAIALCCFFPACCSDFPIRYFTNDQTEVAPSPSCDLTQFL